MGFRTPGAYTPFVLHVRRMNGPQAGDFGRSAPARSARHRDTLPRKGIRVDGFLDSVDPSRSANAKQTEDGANLLPAHVCAEPGLASWEARKVAWIARRIAGGRLSSRCPAGSLPRSNCAPSPRHAVLQSTHSSAVARGHPAVAAGWPVEHAGRSFPAGRPVLSRSV